MCTHWLEIRLAVNDETVDLVSQVLTDLGSVGIIAGEQQLDTFVAPDPDQFRNAPQLRAFFPFPADLEAFGDTIRQELEALQAFLPDFELPDLEFHDLQNADWAHDWRQHFPPLQIGQRLVVCPSWVEWPQEQGQIVLTLDPGQAFGTGTHATTGLCLELIAELCDSPRPPATALDVGTGSAILAMAAVALGVGAVVACDIDHEACRVARENVRHNGLQAQIEVTDNPIETIPGQFDLLLANILAAENIRLARTFIDHLSSNGVLLLSGILAEQESQVKEAYSTLPVDLLEVRHREEWICMVYRRHD